MRTISCILSLLIHGLILFLIIYFPEMGKNVSIDLKEPVYEVNLVKFQEKKSRQTGKNKAKTKDLKKQKSPSQEKPQKKQVKSRNKPQKPKSREKAPEGKTPSTQDSKKKIPKRPEKDSEKKTEKKSQSEAEPEKKQEKEKPEKRDIPQKKAERPSKREKKQKSAPSSEEILSDTISAVQKDIRKRSEQSREILNRELAKLESESGKKGAKSAHPASSSSYTREVYARILEAKIKQNWSYPVFGNKKDIRAEAKIFLDKKGNIVKSKIIQESGNSKFDNSVLRAIGLTGKLPAPPQGNLKKITITFDLQENKY